MSLWFADACSGLMYPSANDLIGLRDWVFRVRIRQM